MSHKLKRRDFIKISALGAASNALSGCTSSWKVPTETKKNKSDSGRSISQLSQPLEPASKTRIKLAQVSGPGVSCDITNALLSLINPLGGMGSFVKKGQRVLLKPNMGFAVANELRANTDVALIAEVAQMALTAGAKEVVIADYSVSDSAEVIALMGLKEAVKSLKGVKVLAITDDNQYVETKIPKGKSIEETELLRIVQEVDVHIALPIAKSHSSAGFTGTLKGMMGVIRSRRPFHYRYDLHQAICDLNTIIKPNLIIMDGLSVMTTDGPKGPGKVVKCDSLIAGTDPVAVDAAGVRLAPLHGQKVEPHEVRHLVIAQKMGLGKIDLPTNQSIKSVLT